MSKFKAVSDSGNLYKIVRAEGPGTIPELLRSKYTGKSKAERAIVAYESFIEQKAKAKPKHIKSKISPEKRAAAEAKLKDARTENKTSV